MKLIDKLKDIKICEKLANKFNEYKFDIVEDEETEDNVEILYRYKWEDKDEYEKDTDAISSVCYNLFKEAKFLRDDILKMCVRYDYLDEIQENEEIFYVDELENEKSLEKFLKDIEDILEEIQNDYEKVILSYNDCDEKIISNYDSIHSKYEEQISNINSKIKVNNATYSESLSLVHMNVA